jgi:hypothetical protein
VCLAFPPTEGRTMVDKQQEAHDALLSRIAELAPKASPESVKDLAEAYAFVAAPAQDHG